MLTGPQQRYLAEIVEAGTRSYNGRARRPVEALEAAGLIEYDYDLIPHVDKGGQTYYTERFTCQPTLAGREQAMGGRVRELGDEIRRLRARFDEAVEQGVRGAPLTRMDQKIVRLELEQERLLMLDVAHD